MSITFQKRQKELKRQEKQRAKAERREQRKAVKHAAKDAPSTFSSQTETDDGSFAEQSRTKESM